VLRYLLLVAIAGLFVGPFLILLSAATKPATQDVFGFPPDLIPRPPVLDYFVEAWSTIPYATFLMNSVIYIVIIIPLYLAVSALTAYPLARIAFRGRGLFFLLFLSTMFLPGELMLIPRFLVMSQLQLTDTYTAVILPAILSSLGIFLLRQAFSQIPDEIVEAARIDGAGEFAIFWRICLPIVRPTLAVLSILGFISVWNSFIWPLVVLTSQSKYPIALGLAYLTGVSGTDVRGLAAGTIISLIPVLIIFVLLQRHILNSMSGAVKG
jgi:putative chitobiose transport system permease protein